MYGIIGGLASVRAMRQAFFTSGRPYVLVSISVVAAATWPRFCHQPQMKMMRPKKMTWMSDDDDVADRLVLQRDREPAAARPAA